MNDLIKREDAIDELMHIIPYKRYYNGEYVFLLDKRKCLEAIKAVPAADRLQGEWIESFKRVEVKQGTCIDTKFVHDGWSCSECSEVVEKRYPNCPYCLARMKGAEDD